MSISALVTGPAVPVVTVEEAKAFDCLNIQHDDDDTAIASLISAATDMVDAEFGELGRALITQTWSLTLSAFPSARRITLPVSPVQQVTQVQYFDVDNTQQTFDSNAYRLISARDEGYLDLVEGQDWPATADRADAVEIQYEAGFGAASTDVPEGIRRAVKAMVRQWYDHPSAVSDKGLETMPLGVRTLLHKYRVARGFI